VKSSCLKVAVGRGAGNEGRDVEHAVSGGVRVADGCCVGLRKGLWNASTEPEWAAGRLSDQ